jgi:hypothetical protein
VDLRPGLFRHGTGYVVEAELIIRRSTAARAKSDSKFAGLHERHLILRILERPTCRSCKKI